MGRLAAAVRFAIDLILRPFDALGPLWVLLASSLITAVAILLVVRVTTPARWVDRARSQVAACIYEIRLFLDSPRRVLAIQGRLLYWSGAYILSLTPAFLVMSVPMGLLFLQLDVRLGYQPLPTKTPLVVRVDLDGAAGQGVSASAGDWGRVTAPPLFDAERDRVYLRVVIDRPGTHQLDLAAGGHTVKKRLVAAAATRMSPARSSGASMWWALTDEDPLPSDSGFASISVPHPDATTHFLWMPWWIFWLVVSTAMALALKRPMRVSI